jgi:hypothetical protein
MTTASATQRKSAKSTVSSRTSTSVKASQTLTGQALLKDMQQYHKQVVATPKSARDFLTRLGVMTSDGKAKKLIRA